MSLSTTNFFKKHCNFLEEKSVTAFHEAAHYVIARHFNVPVKEVYCYDLCGELFYEYGYEYQNKENEACVLFAGPICEFKILLDVPLRCKTVIKELRHNVHCEEDFNGIKGIIREEKSKKINMKLLAIITRELVYKYKVYIRNVAHELERSGYIKGDFLTIH
jgi:hypothetical protein